MLEKRGLIERDAENAWRSNDPYAPDHAGGARWRRGRAQWRCASGRVSLHAGPRPPPVVNEAFLEVRPSNLAAICFYQRPGFEQIGIGRGYHQAPDGREDAIVLKLMLRQAGT